MSRADSKKQDPLKKYYTPAWAVREILPELQERIVVQREPLLGRIKILEPAAGSGAIVLAMIELDVEHYGAPIVDAIEAREEERMGLVEIGAGTVAIGDFLTYPLPGARYDLTITNPPYTLAREFVDRACQVTRPGGTVAMLLRMGFAAGQSRREWHLQNVPDMFPLSRRPSFQGKGSDATDYAWFLWTVGRRKQNGIWRAL